MRALKILFYITMTLFFILGSAAIINSTNFWKNKIYLSCTVNELTDSFSLVIDKKHKEILWNGKTVDEDIRKRKLDSFTEVTIEMSWMSQKKTVDVDFFLDRLTGEFRLLGEKDGKKEFSFKGSCYEKQKSF
jgi:hypothetical protein